MAFDYSKLRGKIREVFSTQKAFADALGMSTVSLSSKLNNRVEFSQEEINKSCVLLDIEAANIPVYFFTVKVKEA